MDVCAGGLFTGTREAKNNGVRLFPCVSGQKEKVVSPNPFLQTIFSADTRIVIY